MGPSICSPDPQGCRGYSLLYLQPAVPSQHVLGPTSSSPSPRLFLQIRQAGGLDGELRQVSFPSPAPGSAKSCSKDRVFQNGSCTPSVEAFLSRKTAVFPEGCIHRLLIFTGGERRLPCPSLPADQSFFFHKLLGVTPGSGGFQPGLSCEKRQRWVRGWGPGRQSGRLRQRAVTAPGS